MQKKAKLQGTKLSMTEMKMGKIDRCIPRLAQCSAMLLGVVIPLRFVDGLPIPQAAQLALCPIVLILALLKKPRKPLHICWALLIFVAVVILSYIVHPAPDTLRRGLRLVTLLLGLATFSPLVSNDSLQRMRRTILQTMVTTMAVIVLISFGLWIFDELFTPKGWWTHNNYGFKGITNMGMTLSPMAAIVALASFWALLNLNTTQHFNLNRLRHRKTVIAILVLIALISIFTCFIGGSRITCAGLIVALVAMCIHQRRRILQLLRRRSVRLALLVTSLAGALLLPSSLEAIKFKIAVSATHGTQLYSRAQLWQDRLHEFSTSPLTGIGYSAQLPTSRPNLDNPLALEPGSSWLSLLSFTGLLGAISFALFLITLLRRTRHLTSRTRAILLPLLLLFLINGITEGWLLFAGALLFPVFWLTCSLIYDSKTVPTNVQHNQ